MGLNKAQQVAQKHGVSTKCRRLKNNTLVFLEDYQDPDGRTYSLMFHCTPDATRAVAYCTWNPWGWKTTTKKEYLKTHIADDGHLCLNNPTKRNVWVSLIDLHTAITRAHFWCAAFSYFKETGTFPKL